MATAGGERDERAARNQSVFRDVNERIEVVAQSFSVATDHADFVCECADASCTELMQLTIAEYEALRRRSNLFAVRPGHVVPEVEEVVAEHDGYLVVRKLRGAGDLADELDRRDAPKA